MEDQMGYYYTPGLPGTEFGPCEDEHCGHVDCAADREQSDSPCLVCGQPLGYNVPVYYSVIPGQPGSYAWNRATHHDCLWLDLTYRSQVKETGGDYYWWIDHNVYPADTQVYEPPLKPLRTQDQIDAAYPEHVKLKEHLAEIEAGENLIEHLKSEGIVFARWRHTEDGDDDLSPTYAEVDRDYLSPTYAEVDRPAIWAFYGVDYAKVMREKDDMVKQLQARYLRDEKDGDHG